MLRLLNWKFRSLVLGQTKIVHFYPDRLEPIFQLPVPYDLRSLRITSELFPTTHFIKNFSEQN